MSDQPTAVLTEIAKDGYWLVPPEKRPKDWRLMGLRERVTVTEKSSKTTVTEREMLVQETPLLAEQRPESAVVKWVPPFIPEASPFDAELLALTFKFWGDEKIPEAEYEEILDGEQISSVSDKAHQWRQAKKLVDEILVLWVERHRDKLRHIGIGSPAMRDLFIMVHQLATRLLDEKAGA